MTFALRAAVLVVIQAEAGTWCSLAWVAGRVIRPQHEIEQICNDLVDEAELQAMTLADGTRCFGTDCSSIDPDPPVRRPPVFVGYFRTP